MRKSLTLSERPLMGCVSVGSTCYGGLMGNGFAFAADNATCTEDSNSYTGTKGTCSDLSCTVGLAQGSVTRFRK